MLDIFFFSSLSFSASHSLMDIKLKNRKKKKQKKKKKKREKLVDSWSGSAEIVKWNWTKDFKIEKKDEPVQSEQSPCLLFISIGRIVMVRRVWKSLRPTRPVNNDVGHSEAERHDRELTTWNENQDRMYMRVPIYNWETRSKRK